MHAHRIERSAALKSFVCRLCCRVESSRRLVAAHLGVAGAPVKPLRVCYESIPTAW